MLELSDTCGLSELATLMKHSVSFMIRLAVFLARGRGDTPRIPRFKYYFFYFYYPYKEIRPADKTYWDA
jgi:hypothetical protein